MEIRVGRLPHDCYFQLRVRSDNTKLDLKVGYGRDTAVRNQEVSRAQARAIGQAFLAVAEGMSDPAE